MKCFCRIKSALGSMARYCIALKSSSLQNNSIFLKIEGPIFCLITWIRSLNLNKSFNKWSDSLCKHNTKHHHFLKNERRHSATVQSPFSWLNGRYISVTIRSPFSAIQSPFRRLQTAIKTIIYNYYRIRRNLLFYQVLDNFDHFVGNSFDRSIDQSIDEIVIHHHFFSYIKPIQ